MEDNYLIFEGLFSIWKERHFDLYFYFNEIFRKVLDGIKDKNAGNIPLITKRGTPIYKAIFIPVGFSIENVAVISSLFQSDYVRFAYTETTMRYHRRHIHIVKEHIKKFVPSIHFSEETIIKNDQIYSEKKIFEWANEMKAAYGFSYNELAIDLTGGTKPMSIGAQNASESLDIQAFYLSTEYDMGTQRPIPGTESLLKMVRRQTKTEDDVIFIVMPFKKEFDPLYAIIEETTKEAGFKCIRADKEIFIGAIMEKVSENIIRSGIIIAEVTEHNPNVYYELGFAHAWNKKVVMLTQDITKIPFDLRHLKMLVYDIHKVDELKIELKKHLISLKNI